MDFFDRVEVLANGLCKRRIVVPLFWQPRRYVDSNTTMPHALVCKSLGIREVRNKRGCEVKNDSQVRILG